MMCKKERNLVSSPSIAITSTATAIPRVLFTMLTLIVVGIRTIGTCIAINQRFRF
jgi:hypothetical protein